MPQINQLSAIFVSQLFWLAVVFGVIYFVVGRAMVPKIRQTVGNREAQIASDLERAQAARETADQTEAAWRERMDAARVEAARIANEAKQAAARDTEAKVKAVADKLAAKGEASEQQIRAALDAARGEIESVAAEATQQLVARLTGIAVDKKEVTAAVKADMHA